jgi:hypothetical protein
LTFITCTTFLVIRYGLFTGKGTVDTSLPVIPQESKSNILEVIIPSVVVLFLMIMVIVLAFREQRKK